MFIAAEYVIGKVKRTVNSNNSNGNGICEVSYRWMAQEM